LKDWETGDHLEELNGILCIDKPQGFTSFDVVAKLRGIAKTRRIGHAGTLDPMATGVLPLFLGRATKACDLLPDQDKRYTAVFRLGLETDTLDITGTVVSEHPVEVSEAQVREAASRFTGEILQVPPMYSALKVGGKKLCDLARQGVEVEREARPVRIHRLEFLSCDSAAQTYTIDVACSKGTYIRTLVADIGEVLGCGAVLTALRRTEAAGYDLGGCVTLEEVQGCADAGRLPDLLRPVSSAFGRLAQVRLAKAQDRLFRNGVRLDTARLAFFENGTRLGRVPEGNLSVYSSEGIFLGIARATGGELRLVKLFVLEV